MLKFNALFQLKRWSLLIGEPKAATASTAKKRTTVKRIGSMADMQCFLKFIIRVFRQSRGGSGKFTRPWVGWLCKHKQTKLADFKKTLTSIPLQYACRSQDWPPVLRRDFPIQIPKLKERSLTRAFHLWIHLPGLKTRRRIETCNSLANTLPIAPCNTPPGRETERGCPPRVNQGSEQQRRVKFSAQGSNV